MPTREEVRQLMARDGIRYLLAQFVDINGSPKVKMVPASHLDDMIDDGAGFAGAAVLGLGQGPHSHDMMARIDLDTYSPAPWAEGVARFAADLYVDGEPHMYCARQNLKRVLSNALADGFTFHVGIEPEHFLVTRNDDGSISVFDPKKVDSLAKPCYDFKGIASVTDYLRDLMDGMDKLGWDPYQSDHEDANGQYELNFVFSEALTTADRYTFFKMMTSQIAQKHGAIATHMAKPFRDRTGSGGHIHIHVEDAETQDNLFLDEDDPQGLGLSQFAYNFIGGIIAHAPALCAVTSPTVNCYKRLRMGPGLTGARSGFTWTPAFISYGDNNRTQMIRTAGPGHLEDRTVSAACNPVSRLRRLPCGRPRRREQRPGPRESQPGQPVRARHGGDPAQGHRNPAPEPAGGPRRAAKGRGRAGVPRRHLRRVHPGQGSRVERVPRPSLPVGDRPLPDDVLVS